MGQPSRFLSRRRSDLAKIHLGAKQLVGDDEEARRDMFEAVTGKRSAAKLDEDERREVLKHLVACGAKFERPAGPAPSDADDPGGPAARKVPRPRPRPALVQPIKTIDALCINHPGGRKPRGWAEAILKRMTRHSHRTPLEWATEGQLRDVEKAIRKDIWRHNRRGGPA
ncbi:MAG: DUF1018 domain-containing protein [Bryobacterales bacterium]|nr:DUF1018 domain-containing protein [Bryobacterales bacterium]